MFRVLDLFSGIGGFSLGLERTGGFKTVAFCEINPFGRATIEKQWPSVPVYHDVRAMTAKGLERDGISVDVITGGFPCQDISLSGSGAGLAGSRSSLWWEMYRLIREIRPVWVIIENSPALRGRGLDQILRALTAIRYDAEWHCIPACALDANHERDRVWIIAYPHCLGLNQGGAVCRRHQKRNESDYSTALSNALRLRLAHRLPAGFAGRTDPARETMQAATGCDRPRWPDQPPVGELVHGLPRGLAGWRRRAIEALGNAVCPQVVELIGLAILDVEQQA